MEDLDKLLADYKGAFLKYPEERRKVEHKLLSGIVAEINALKAQLPRERTEEEIMALLESTRPVLPKRGPGRPPKEAA